MLTEPIAEIRKWQEPSLLTWNFLWCSGESPYNSKPLRYGDCYKTCEDLILLDAVWNEGCYHRIKYYRMYLGNRVWYWQIHAEPQVYHFVTGSP